jgi:hypothetical protein
MAISDAERAELQTAVEARRLRRVVRATVEAMREASPRTSKESPFRRFGVQYNRIRDEARRLFPTCPMMPPRVPVGRKVEDGDAPIEARYLEVRAYLAQLDALLSDDD